MSPSEMTTGQLSREYIYANAMVWGLHNASFSPDQKAHAREILAEHTRRLWQAWEWEQTLVACLPVAPPFAIGAWQWAEEIGFASELGKQQEGAA